MFLVALVKSFWSDYHRYFFALPLVQGKRVLDIDSGDGYDNHILARSAACATGVDISGRLSLEYGDQYTCENTRFSKEVSPGFHWTMSAWIWLSALKR